MVQAASPLLLEQLFRAASGESLHSDGLRRGLFFTVSELNLFPLEAGTDWSGFRGGKVAMFSCKVGFLILLSLEAVWLTLIIKYIIQISTVFFLMNENFPPQHFSCVKLNRRPIFYRLRVRFLLGGRHGDFKFLPPSSYAPCYEALLPKEKMKVEPVKEYKRDAEGVRDLLGTTQFMSQASFIPTPVETSQVRGTVTWRLLN